MCLCPSLCIPPHLPPVHSLQVQAQFIPLPTIQCLAQQPQNFVLNASKIKTITTLKYPSAVTFQTAVAFQPAQKNKTAATQAKPTKTLAQTW